MKESFHPLVHHLSHRNLGSPPQHYDTALLLHSLSPLPLLLLSQNQAVPNIAEVHLSMYVTSKCTEPVRSLFCTNSVTSCKLCANSRAKMGGVKKKEWVIDIVASAGHYKGKNKRPRQRGTERPGSAGGDRSNAQTHAQRQAVRQARCRHKNHPIHQHRYEHQNPDRTWKERAGNRNILSRILILMLLLPSHRFPPNPARAPARTPARNSAPPQTGLDDAASTPSATHSCSCSLSPNICACDSSGDGAQQSSCRLASRWRCFACFNLHAAFLPSSSDS